MVDLQRAKNLLGYTIFPDEFVAGACEQIPILITEIERLRNALTEARSYVLNQLKPSLAVVNLAVMLDDALE